MANRQNHPGNLPPLQPSAPVLRGGGRQPKHRPPLRRRPFHPRLERRIPLHRKGIRFVDHHQLKTAVKPPCLMGRRRRERAVRPDPAALPVQNAYRDIRKSPFQPRRQLFHHIPARRNPQNGPPCSKTRWTAGRTASVFPDPATAHTRNRFSPDRTASRQRSATHFCPAVRAGRRKSTRTRQASLFSSGKKKKRGVQARERPKKRHRSQLTHWLPHRPHRERNNPSGPVPHRLQRQRETAGGISTPGSMKAMPVRHMVCRTARSSRSSMGSASSPTKAFTSSQSRERPAKSGRRKRAALSQRSHEEAGGGGSRRPEHPSPNAGAPNACAGRLVPRKDGFPEPRPPHPAWPSRRRPQPERC